MIDIDNIEVLARSASPGPWFFSPMTETVDPEISAANGTRVATLAAADITKANCAYIAAANPSAVLALIKELKSNTRMFLAACDELGAVNEKLGLDPNDGGAEPILNAIEELQAAARASATLLAQEPERMDTEQSREYLVQFMERHFSDTTYHRYIRAESGNNALAGDFAWQLARALRMRSYQEQHVTAPVEHLPTVVEQAANLAIKLTAAPRDYLGPASSVMKMQAALGEKIAEAIRALRVPAPSPAAPATAAAPQVAADEPDKTPVGVVVQSEFGIRFQVYTTGGDLKPGTKLYAPPVLAAAPLSAQEPVDGENDIATSAKRFLACVNERKDAEISFTTAAGHTEYDRARCQLQKSLGATPVRLVAVPDAGIANDANRYQHIKRFCFHRTMNGYDKRVTAWNLHIAACEDDPNNLDAALDIERQFHGEKPFYAAPAAQGDAKELTDERIYDIAASCEIGIGHNDHETSQRFEFARAIHAAIVAKTAS